MHQTHHLFIPILIFYAQQGTDLLIVMSVCVPTLLTHCSIQEVAQLEFLITYSFSHLTNALCNAAGRESRPPAGFYVNPCNRSFTGSKLGELFQNLGPKKIGALKWRSFLQQYQLSSFQDMFYFSLLYLYLQSAETTYLKKSKMMHEISAWFLLAKKKFFFHHRINWDFSFNIDLWMVFLSSIKESSMIIYYARCALSFIYNVQVPTCKTEFFSIFKLTKKYFGGTFLTFLSYFFYFSCIVLLTIKTFFAHSQHQTCFCNCSC